MGSVQVAHVPTEQEQQAAAEIAEMMEKSRQIMQDPEKVTHAPLRRFGVGPSGLLREHSPAGVK